MTETTERARKRATYPAYKPSGMDWVGDIPEHWDVHRLKHIASVQLSSVDKHTIEDEEPVRLCNYVDVYYNDFIREGIDFMAATATRSEIDRFRLRHGDVLVTKDSEAWDDIAVPAYVAEDLDGVLCGYHLAHIRPNPRRALGEYLFRVFRSRGINDQFRVAANGITRFGLGKYWLDNGLFPVPPLAEQKAIAAFLDRETARIDALIEKKRRQIELLQEKRSAVISHAVTKGLDSNAPMKNSGIEWLGQIPQHWEIRRIKFLLDAMIDTEHKTVPFYEDGEYLVVRTSNVRNGTLVVDGAKYTDVDGYREWTRRGKPRPGDILFTREAPAGEACRVPSDYPCCIGQRMVLFRVRQDRLSDRFGVYSIYSGLASVFIRLLSQGTTVAHFNMRDIGSIPMLVPSIDEQIRIADWLDYQCERTSTLVGAVDTSIKHLNEFRTTLISAAVTGKIDVRST